MEVNVSDLESSTEFWRWFLEALGYEKFQAWDGGVSWRLDDTYIVFVQTGPEYLDRGYHRRGVGLNHLAFHAGSEREVDGFTDSLRKRGVKILYEDRHPYAGGSDHYAVFFEDPDRIKVELAAPGNREE